MDMIKEMRGHYECPFSRIVEVLPEGVLCESVQEYLENLQESKGDWGI